MKPVGASSDEPVAFRIGADAFVAMADRNLQGVNARRDIPLGT